MDSQAAVAESSPSDTASKSLQETIAQAIQRAPQGVTPRDVFIKHVWPVLEPEYTTMVHTLVEFCKTKLGERPVRCNITGRAKSCDSIEKSLTRREAHRLEQQGTHYGSLQEVLDDIHDLAGIRIVVDFRSDIDAVSTFVQETFQQLKDPNVFSADRQISEIWQPLFGAYKTCNHRVAVKLETHGTLSRFCGVMFEVQLTDISESLYNRFAHSLLYKESSGRLHRQDEIVVDMSHGISLLYSLCLMYMKDRLEGPARSGDENDKILGAMRLAEVEGNLDRLVQAVSKTTGSEIRSDTTSSGAKPCLKRRGSFRESILIEALKKALQRAEAGSLSKDELWQLLNNKVDEIGSEDDQESIDADDCIRKQHYNADRLNIERLSGALLPMDQCYINLAILETSASAGDSSTPSTFSIFACQRVETPDSKAQTQLPKLFGERPGRNNRPIHPRRILIRGRAGVGKTTLCKKIVHDFTHGNQTDLYRTWTKLFDRLLWLPLRNLKRRSAPGYNHEDIFYHKYFSGQGYERGRRLAAGLWRTLDCTKSGRTLFILDGLDEVTELMDRGSEMFHFLQDLLHQPNVIITSRPNASLPISIRDVDLKLETVRFYPAQVEAYLKVDPKISPRFGEVQTFLQSHWLLQGLMRIPVQLDALCYTWEDFDHGTAPETITDIYKAIEERLWKKDILRLEKKHDGEPISRCHINTANVEEFVQGEIDLLQGLAFTGLHNDVIDFTPEHLRTISRHFKGTGILLDKTLSRLSFLRASSSSPEGVNFNYHFLHLTFQEYFAARYFVLRWISKEKLSIMKLDTRRRGSMVTSISPEDLLRRQKYNARYDVFWRFVAGLLDASDDEEHICRYFQVIEGQPRDLLGPVHQRLIMHCLSEVGPLQESSEWTQLRQSLEAQLKQWLLFECKFRPGGELFASDFPLLSAQMDFPRLSAQMEFPDRIVELVLREGPESIQGLVVQSLSKRPIVCQAIVSYVFSWSTGTASRQPEPGASEAFRRQLAARGEVTHALVALLQDSKPEAQEFAESALSRQSHLSMEILQALLALWRGGWRHTRLLARQVLRTKSTLPWETLQALISSPSQDPNFQHEILHRAASMMSMSSKEIIHVMETLLQDADIETWNFAAIVFRSYSTLPEHVLHRLIAKLHHPERRMRVAATKALQGQSNLPEEAILALVTLLQDPERVTRSSAASLLWRQSILSEDVILALMALLNDTATETRSFAASVLGSRPDLSDVALQALVASLSQDPDRSTRLYAAEVLGKQSDLPEGAIQALIASLSQDPDRSTLSSAAYALCKQSHLSQGAIRALIASLSHNPDDSIALTAQLTSLQHPNLLNDAVHGLKLFSSKDLDSQRRSSAAKVLSQQKKLTEDALQALLSLLQDPHPDVLVRLSSERGLHRYLSTSSPERVATFLLSMDSCSFAAIYGMWLRRSFSDHLVCYATANSCKIVLPETEWELPFDLSTRVAEARNSLKVPDGSVP